MVQTATIMQNCISFNCGFKRPVLPTAGIRTRNIPKISLASYIMSREHCRGVATHVLAPDLAESVTGNSVLSSPLGQTFDWHRQWYPMMVVEDADPEIPHASQLLGMDVVLWRDKTGAWRCIYIAYYVVS